MYAHGTRKGCQAASVKDILPQLFQIVRQGDSLQVVVLNRKHEIVVSEMPVCSKGIIPDFLDTVRDIDAGQTRAAGEGNIPDFRDTGRDVDAGEPTAAGKGII